MQRVVMGILAVALGLLSSARAEKEAPATGPAPQIVCEQPKMNFGERDNTETVEHGFELRNEGTTTLEILSTRASCGCTVVDVSDKMIAPGSNATLTAKLNLRGRRGKQHKTITVQSNDPTNPKLMLVMEGTATTLVEVNPMRVYVRDVKQGEANVSAVEVVSKAPEPIKILEVKSTSPLVSTRMETLEEGRRYRIELMATNSLPRGLTSGRVTIRTDSKAAPNLSVPFHYQVVGELIVAPEQITFREDKEKTLARNVIIKPGMVKEFTVERVETPLESIKVNIRDMGAYGYQVQLSEIPQSRDLDGKEILIVTSVEPMKEIRIPFRVIPARR